MNTHWSRAIIRACLSSFKLVYNTNRFQDVPDSQTPWKEQPPWNNCLNRSSFSPHQSITARKWAPASFAKADMAFPWSILVTSGKYNKQGVCTAYLQESWNPPQVFTISPGKILRALQAPCTSPQAPAQPWTKQSHTWTHGMQDLEKRAFNSPLPHIKITQGRPEHLASCPFTSIHPFTHSCCCCYLPQKAAVGLRSHSLSFPSPCLWSHSTHKTCSLDTAEVGSTVLREERGWYYTGVSLQMHPYLQHQSTILRPATSRIPKN